MTRARAVERPGRRSGGRPSPEGSPKRVEVAGEGLDEATIRAGYERFKAAKQAKEVEGLAQAHGLAPEALANFIDTILQRMIFDGEQLTDLMEPLDLGWRERRERELALMADLVPLLNRRAHGRDISGLDGYEQGGA